MNSVTHGILVGVVIGLTYLVSAGGVWQTITLGGIAAGVLQWLKSME